MFIFMFVLISHQRLVFFPQTLHAWLPVFMMQLMLFIYEFYAVFYLVRQYCVLWGNECVWMLQSHRMRHFQQGRWKGEIRSLLCSWCSDLSHRMVVFSPIFDVSIFEINYNKHSYRVFKSPPVTVRKLRCAHAHTRSSAVV